MDSRRGLELWGTAGRCLFLHWPRGSWQCDLICGLIIVGLFVLPGPSLQAPLDVDGVLAAIAAADSEIDSFTADMVATERITLFDDEETEGGTVAFLKPGYFRRDVTEPSVSSLVVGDGEVTLYIPRIKQAQILSIEGALEEGEQIAVPGMSTSSELKSAYDVSLEGTSADASDGTTLYVMRLVPQVGSTPAKSYRAITLYVADGEWHPARRIVLENHVGDTTTIELSNVRRNAGLKPADFEIDLPGDVEIVRRGADTP